MSLHGEPLIARVAFRDAINAMVGMSQYGNNPAEFEYEKNKLNTSVMWLTPLQLHYVRSVAAVLEVGNFSVLVEQKDPETPPQMSQSTVEKITALLKALHPASLGDILLNVAKSRGEATKAKLIRCAAILKG